MNTLYFTREFTEGNLFGIRHLDRISFPTAKLCVEWVRTINSKNAAGKCNYRIIDSSFQNYAR